MDSGQKVGDIIQSLIVDLNASPDGLIVQRCLEDGAHAFAVKPKSSKDSVVGPIKVFMASSCDRLDTSVVECDTTVVFGVANGSVGQDSLCTTSIQCLVVADVPVITISVDVLADTPLDVKSPIRPQENRYTLIHMFSTVKDARRNGYASAGLEFIVEYTRSLSTSRAPRKNPTIVARCSDIESITFLLRVGFVVTSEALHSASCREHLYEISGNETQSEPANGSDRGERNGLRRSQREKTIISPSLLQIFRAEKSDYAYYHRSTCRSIYDRFMAIDPNDPNLDMMKLSDTMIQLILTFCCLASILTLEVKDREEEINADHLGIGKCSSTWLIGLANEIHNNKNCHEDVRRVLEHTRSIVDAINDAARNRFPLEYSLMLRTNARGSSGTLENGTETRVNHNFESLNEARKISFPLAEEFHFGSGGEEQATNSTLSTCSVSAERRSRATTDGSTSSAMSSGRGSCQTTLSAGEEVTVDSDRRRHIKAKYTYTNGTRHYNDIGTAYEFRDSGNIALWISPTGESRDSKGFIEYEYIAPYQTGSYWLHRPSKEPIAHPTQKAAAVTAAGKEKKSKPAPKRKAAAPPPDDDTDDNGEGAVARKRQKGNEGRKRSGRKAAAKGKDDKITAVAGGGKKAANPAQSSDVPRTVVCDESSNATELTGVTGNPNLTFKSALDDATSDCDKGGRRRGRRRTGQGRSVDDEVTEGGGAVPPGIADGNRFKKRKAPAATQPRKRVRVLTLDDIVDFHGETGIHDESLPHRFVEYGTYYTAVTPLEGHTVNALPPGSHSFLARSSVQIRNLTERSVNLTFTTAGGEASQLTEA